MEHTSGQMPSEFTSAARRVGIISAMVVVVLLIAYAVTLTVGLVTLESPEQPIGDPMFTILELVIIGLAPAMVSPGRSTSRVRASSARPTKKPSRSRFPSNRTARSGLSAVSSSQ
jgi:hypothetical protein